MERVSRGTVMKAARKFLAIAVCGLTIGVAASMVATAPANARSYATCDSKVTSMEKSAARDFARGKLSAEDYAKVQAEIALHRQLWGC